MKPAGPILFLALAAAIASAGAAAAARAPALPGPASVTQARLVTLRNGLRLLLAPDTAATAVDVAVWSRAGAAREPAGSEGITRLLERLAFAGSESHGPREHARLIAATGGQAGAYSTADLLCLHQTVPPGSLELALRLEADRIASLRLTPEGVSEAARATGDEARRQSEAQPWGPALRAFYDLAWQPHPYRRLAVGAEPDPARIGVTECRSLHQAALAPNELLVTVTGRFDAGEALQAAKRWLEPLPRRRGLPGAGAAGAGPAGQKSPRRGRESLDVPLDLLVVGWRVPERAAAETPALGLLARILAAGPAQRLQRALLPDSIGCVWVQSALDSRREGGLLYVMAAVRPGADSARVERALLEQVERLGREPVSDEELQSARRQEEMGTLLGWQTARGCAEALGSAQLMDGDWRAAALRLEQVRQLTAADLQRAASRALVPAGRTTLWVSTTRSGVPAPPGSGRTAPGQPPSQGAR